MKKTTVRVICRFKDIRGLQSATYKNVYLIDYSLTKKHVIICMQNEDGECTTATFDLDTLVGIQLF